VPIFRSSRVASALTYANFGKIMGTSKLMVFQCRFSI
jgi:hypothetical protein